MEKSDNFLKSPHIQIALATGLSIIILAYFSKRVLPEPIGYLALAIPPFIASIFESLFSKYKTHKFMKTWYWVVAVLLAAAIVIVFHT